VYVKKLAELTILSGDKHFNRRVGDRHLYLVRRVAELSPVVGRHRVMIVPDKSMIMTVKPVYFHVPGWTVYGV